MIRYAAQSELYATPNRLDQLEQWANVSVRNRVDVTRPASITRGLSKGVETLLIDVDFTTDAGAQEVMDAIISQAQQRSAVEPSYVRLVAVDDEARTRQERHADAASGWAVNVGPVESL